jgi:hypothetical protein
VKLPLQKLSVCQKTLTSAVPAPTHVREYVSVRVSPFSLMVTTFRADVRRAPFLRALGRTQSRRRFRFFAKSEVVVGRASFVQ